MPDCRRLLNPGEGGVEEEDHSQWDTGEEGARGGVNLGQATTMGLWGQRGNGPDHVPNYRNTQCKNNN